MWGGSRQAVFSVQELQIINANFKQYFWTEEQNSADQNKPSFLFVLMERGEIDLETIVKNLKDNKSFTPSKVRFYWEQMLEATAALHETSKAWVATLRSHMCYVRPHTCNVQRVVAPECV